MSDWLIDASREYNLQSLEQRDSYAGVVFIPVETLSQVLDWSFQSLPDEILVGLDIDTSKAFDRELISKYTGSMFEPSLFAGQGMFVGEPHLVNRGDSYEVHHVPEEWVDGLFSENSLLREGRYISQGSPCPFSILVPWCRTLGGEPDPEDHVDPVRVLRCFSIGFAWDGWCVGVSM